MSTENKKIRSQASLKVQEWGCLPLAVLSTIAAILALMLWLAVALAAIGVIPSVPEGRHSVLMVTLWMSIALFISPLAWRFMTKAERQIADHYQTIVRGKVIQLMPDEFQGFAIVQGESSVGVPLTLKLSVPLDKWPTLEVGSSYPW